MQKACTLCSDIRMFIYHGFRYNIIRQMFTLLMQMPVAIKLQTYTDREMHCFQRWGRQEHNSETEISLPITLHGWKREVHALLITNYNGNFHRFSLLEMCLCSFSELWVNHCWGTLKNGLVPLMTRASEELVWAQNNTFYICILPVKTFCFL